MMIRRQLELEHSRREQELARRMQEATTRETRSGMCINAFVLSLGQECALMPSCLHWKCVVFAIR